MVSRTEIATINIDTSARNPLVGNIGLFQLRGRNAARTPNMKK